MAEKTTPSLSYQKEQNAPAPTRSEETFVAPPVDIFEDEDKALVVVADLPGVSPKDLDVRVDRGVLTLQARAQNLSQGEAVYREFELAGYYRQFQLPEGVDSGKIDASLSQGVLTVRMPHLEPEQPRRIRVRAS
jgi:HSP20 family molecular chaperone IbpA